MATITLDFSTSYRAITDTDITLPIVFRDGFGWDGQGAPEAAVTLISSTGTTIQPAWDPYAALPAYLYDHSPSANRLDLVSFGDPAKSVLRFQVPVDPAPIWENYVKAIYTGNAEIVQYSSDYNAYLYAYDNWQNYFLTHPFRASAATWSDKGGVVGQFSSSEPLIIEDFTLSALFYAVGIFGSAFNDNFSGGELNDTLTGANGRDIVRGVGGDDLIDGGIDNDTLYGQDGADYLSGDNGADEISGGAGNDTGSGDAGDEYIFGGTGDDVISGVEGNDSIFGGSDADRLFGGDGSDLFYGGDGDDFLVGGAQGDTLNGGNGADTLSGGVDDDALSGGDGKDVLSGGDGWDFLRGGRGNDSLTGGAGNDVFNFNYLGTSNADRIADFVHGTDKIGLDSATFAGVHAAVTAGELRLGPAAQDGDDRIIYDQASGRLYYDPDGTRNGATSAAQVLFGIVVNHALLTFDDFVMA